MYDVNSFIHTSIRRKFENRITKFPIVHSVRHSREDGKKLHAVFARDDFQRLIFNRRKSFIHKVFLEHMEYAAMYRKFGNLALKALLRFIRNAFNHEPQLEEKVRNLYGKSFEGLEKYFSEIFPYLLVEVYNQVELVAVEGENFHSYFF